MIKPSSKRNRAGSMAESEDKHSSSGREDHSPGSSSLSKNRSATMSRRNDPAAHKSNRRPQRQRRDETMEDEDE
jgi:hypothetical protein